MRPDLALTLINSGAVPPEPILGKACFDYEFSGKTCCFSGHRMNRIGVKSENEPLCRTVKQSLRDEIKRAADDGFVNFITGMADGIDIWAAEEVIDLFYLQNNSVRLYAAVPYLGHEKKHLLCSRERYDDIILCCEEVFVICESYSKDCFARRNSFMVQKSDFLICYFDGKKTGGTFLTQNLAAQKGIPINNIYK